MPLIFAEVGSEVTVKAVKGNDETKLFIQKLGILPGSVLNVVSSREGDVIVMVKDARIAINKDIAKRIIV